MQELVKKLGLLPHPEGGFYKEVYRSKGIITDLASNGFSGARNFCTSIYFLLTSENFSAFHKIKQDEIWHFYEGHALNVHVIDDVGNYSKHQLGSDLVNGEQRQLVVPANQWFASSIESENGYALVGCTVAPGFDFEDFELAERNELIKIYPEHQHIITQLTRK